MAFINDIKRAYTIAKDSRFIGNKITLGKTKISREKAVDLTSMLYFQTKRLTQKDIKKWRWAKQIAIDIDNPVRHELYLIYDDAMLDLHLAGAIRNRKLAVMGSPFKLVKDDGTTDKEATKLLKTKWFREFMSLSLDSRFWGHSLIQFGDIIREPKLKFSEVELIPRHHVSPEFGTLLKYYSDDPKRAIPYRGTDLMNWAIEVGGKRDLGELYPVAKETISKKFVLQFWDQFAEIFGMPIRTAKTASRDPKDHAKIENMLESMGSAAWGLFPEGTTLELIANKQTDSYQVYDKRIDRANSEISKKILGQTMTMDNGSSLSQAKVHADVAEQISDADKTFMHDVVNDDLLPFIIKHGWPVENLTFEWDDTYTYSPEEMKEIEEMLLQYYDIDPEFFEDKYGVKILGSKQKTQPPSNGKEDTTEEEVEEEQAGKGEKKKLTKRRLPYWVLEDTDMQEE